MLSVATDFTAGILQKKKPSSLLTPKNIDATIFSPQKLSFWMCATFKQMMNVDTLKRGGKGLVSIDNLFSALISLRELLDCWSRLGDDLEISVT